MCNFFSICAFIQVTVATTVIIDSDGERSSPRAARKASPLPSIDNSEPVTSRQEPPKAVLVAAPKQQQTNSFRSVPAKSTANEVARAPQTSSIQTDGGVQKATVKHQPPQKKSEDVRKKVEGPLAKMEKSSDTFSSPHTTPTCTEISAQKPVQFSPAPKPHSPQDKPR